MVHAIVVQDARHSCCFMYDTYQIHLQMHASMQEILLLLQHAKATRYIALWLYVQFTTVPLASKSYAFTGVPV